MTPPCEYDKDKPIRLDVAARIAFPDGSIGPKGLRKERDRGRLTTEIIAGKEYTTLKAIEKMRELCRVQAKVLASSGERKASAKTAPLGALPVGGSGTEAISTARDALMAKLRMLKQNSPSSSQRSSPPKSRAEGAAVTPIR